MRKRLWLALLLLLAFNQIGFGQNQQKARHQLEAFCFPFLFFNHASIGYSIKKPGKPENSLVLAGNAHLIYNGAININATYNRNFDLKGENNYLPVWLRISNTRRNVGYEEGYHPHKLAFAIGTGYGALHSRKNKNAMRVEIGLGASFVLTSAKGRPLDFNLQFSDYAIDDRYPKQQPPIRPAVRLRFSWTRVLKKSTL